MCLNFMISKLSMLSKISTDILKYFSHFPQKIAFDISCKMPILFSGKNKKNINLASAEFAHSMLMLKFKKKKKKKKKKVPCHAKTCLQSYADIENPDQHVHLCSLIRAFTVG